MAGKAKGPSQNDHDMSGEYGGGTRPKGPRMDGSKKAMAAAAALKKKNGGK
jgi:hypothetical protein